MPPRGIRPEQVTLRHLYVDERLAMREIAARLGCGPTTIARCLRRFGIEARPRGPAPLRDGRGMSWSSAVAYAIGLIATDGNLSRDGRHISVVSKDLDQLEALRRCLGLRVAISEFQSARGRRVGRVQWNHRAFYDALLTIGLTPAKSLTLGPLAVPDEYFVDFFRGCIDGDGSIVTYIDRYNTFKKPSYVYTRLYVSIVSASLRFLDWLKATVQRLAGVTGYLTVKRAAARNDLWC